MRQSKKSILKFIVFGPGWLSLICVMTLIQRVTPTEPNSLAYFRQHYGAIEKDVRQVSIIYDIPTEDFHKYGSLPFPANYVKHSLGWAAESSNRPVVPRQEVEALLKGYVSRCVGEQHTLYLFYSKWLRRDTVFHSEAFIIEVIYYPNQTLQTFRAYGAGSSDGGWDRAIVAPTCDPPAKY